MFPSVLLQGEFDAAIDVYIGNTGSLYDTLVMGRLLMY